MANELVAGEPRLGFIYDGLPETPHVAVELRRVDDEIEFRLPWNDDYNPKHERWFSGDTLWGDDPDRSKHRYEVPPNITFVDPAGPVALVGCRAVGHSSNPGLGVGIGRATAKFAVFGASDAGAYGRINGLRSEIEGLPAFLGLESLQHDHEVDDENRITAAVLRLQAPPPIAIGRKYLNLQLRPAYSFGPGQRPEETVVRDRTLLQTHRRDALDWDDHLDVHLAVRDLLRVATWRQLHFTSHAATLGMDPLRTLDGKPRGLQWLEVDTTRTDLLKTPIRRRGLWLDFLFRFDTLGSRGVSRWIELHRENPRVMQPVLRLLELREASLETHLAQMGMGLEALGYLESIKAGTSRKIAKDESFFDRVSRVATKLHSCLPFDAGDASEEVTRAYNSVKHANRDLPSGDAMYVAYLKGIQIFRAWVCAATGLSARRSKLAFQRDRITREISSR